jgi:hypothetical protein
MFPAILKRPVATYLFPGPNNAVAIFGENCKLLLLYLEFTQFITE